ncbi:MAG: TonB-dependent receptor [Flavobacterium sp.]|nr:TonB-dependent receptor [Flavobacterium sp.]
MKYSIYMLFFGTLLSYGQTISDSTKNNQLNEVIVHSKKINKSKLFISQKTDVITQKEIEFQNFQNTADLIANSGTAHVQKSQQGGGSPTLRGFEASRILLLVDGIRMNNLIFRAGHLQNIVTVDENMLENVDVFYGSSSSLFGSDALGGAINLTTKKAKFSNGTKLFSGALLSRYSSVNEEKTGHLDINIGLKNFASLTSFSYNDFGDLKMGRKQNGGIPFFGERNYYIETINGVDQLIANDDKYVQKFTAYKQYDFMQKFALRQENGMQHSLNIQYSTSTDVPRYDRLTDSNGSGLRNAEWFYGPQKRFLGVYTFDKKKFILDSDLTINAAYQNVEESRHNRRVNNYNLQNRNEKVDVYSFDFTLKKKFSKSDLIYGFESYYDDLKSTAYSNNINTGVEQTIDTRYPNGKNNMSRNDLFAYFNQALSTKTNWNIGGRIGYATLKSTIADNSIFELPFTSIEQQNVTYSGTIGIIHKPSKEVSLIANLSTGYRVPNIDDLAKIFESGAGTVVVPNENLKPEKTVTADLGVRVATENKRFEFETNYYYTRFIDAIVTDTFTFNGSDTIVYDGATSVVLANQNKGKAFVTGFSTSVKWFMIDNLLFNGNFNYTLGRVVDDYGNQSPLDHIPPYFGKLGLSYNKTRFGLEAYILYNGKKDIKDYLLNGEDNEQYAPDGGMPAWYTFNVKGSLTVYKNATLFAGIENMADIQYRTFASGMNAPGRNIYGGLKVTF